MKKLAAVFIVLIGVLAFALSGCSSGKFTEKAYHSGESAIESIDIGVIDRELEISASEDNEVHIDYSESKKEYLDIKVSENKKLTVTLKFNKNWTDYIGIKTSISNRKIKIRVPDNLIASFSASTTNENIKINALSFAESVSLNSNGGNIICERVNVGKAISLTAKNGDITGSVNGGWDDFSISCTIKKGDCNLPTLKEGGAKSFSANCNNGDINIEFIK